MATTIKNASLVSMPSEIIHEICSWFGFTGDVASFARVCKSLNPIVSPLLYRTILVEISPGEGIHIRYLNSLLRGRSASQRNNMKSIRTFGLIGKLHPGPGIPATSRLIVDHALFHFQLILEAIDNDIVTKFIWDTDITLNEETQRALVLKQKKINSLTIYQYPAPSTHGSHPNWIIFDIGPLTTIHVEGINSVPLLQAIISAIERDHEILAHIGLGFYPIIISTLKVLTRHSRHKAAHGAKDAEIIQFPALGSIQIGGISDWDDFVSTSKLKILKFEAWQGIKQLSMEHTGSANSLIDALETHMIRPTSLKLLLTDPASVPRLCSYLENSKGLVEVCLRLSGQPAPNTSFSINFTKSSKTLRRLFLSWRHENRQYPSNKAYMESLSTLEVLEELAVAYHGSKIPKFAEDKFPALKHLWLLDINGDFTPVPRTQPPIAINRARPAMAGEGPVVNFQEIYNRYLIQAVLPPKVRILSLGQVYHELDAVRPAIIMAVCNHQMPWPMPWVGLVTITLTRRTFERYYKGFGLFQMVESQYFRDLQIRPDVKQKDGDKGPSL
ncbi:hypothetical protein TWF506_009714 [Arthrobotrys conoides]|uniref:F-box domain-containing protein n=1 Tax=Arthrobotrys conoides TaxID=74498 RepID=A0AAN8RWK3_9PEZI